MDATSDATPVNTLQGRQLLAAPLVILFQRLHALAGVSRTIDGRDGRQTDAAPGYLQPPAQGWEHARLGIPGAVHAFLLVVLVVLVVIGALAGAPSSRNPLNKRYKRRKEQERRDDVGSGGTPQ